MAHEDNVTYLKTIAEELRLEIAYLEEYALMADKVIDEAKRMRIEGTFINTDSHVEFQRAVAEFEQFDG